MAVATTVVTTAAAIVAAVTSPPRMQVFDSNGPDVRIRGTAWQVHEKYLALAKDAASSGDTIMTESYMQHAEHYQRIINTFTEQMGHWTPPVSNTDQTMDLDGDDNQGENMDGDDGEQQVAQRAERPQQSDRPQGERSPRRRNNNRRDRDALPSDTDEDLGLPASMLKPSGVAPEDKKVAESA